MSTTRSFTTYMCGRGVIFVGLLVSMFTLLKQAKWFCPSIFMAQEPQIPSLASSQMRHWLRQERGRVIPCRVSISYGFVFRSGVACQLASLFPRLSPAGSSEGQRWIQTLDFEEHVQHHGSAFVQVNLVGHHFRFSSFFWIPTVDLEDLLEFVSRIVCGLRRGRHCGRRHGRRGHVRRPRREQPQRSTNRSGEHLPSARNPPFRTLRFRCRFLVSLGGPVCCFSRSWCASQSRFRSSLSLGARRWAERVLRALQK